MNDPTELEQTIRHWQSKGYQWATAVLLARRSLYGTPVPLDWVVIM